MEDENPISFSTDVKNGWIYTSGSIAYLACRGTAPNFGLCAIENEQSKFEQSNLRSF